MVNLSPSDTNQFLASIKELLPQFCNVLKDTEYPKRKVKFFRNHFQAVMMEIRNRANHGLISQDIAACINDYVTKTLLQRNPNHSKHDAMDLLIFSKKFLNYLAMNKLLNNKSSQEIYQNLYSKSDLKKEYDNYFSTCLQPQINDIKEKLHYVGTKLKGCCECNPEYKEYVDHFNELPDGVFMKALIEVLEEIDSGHTYLNIIEFIYYNLGLESIPERIINYLEKAPQDEVYHKLLVLYSCFSRSGRSLDVYFEDLIVKLSPNYESYNEFVVQLNRVISKRNPTC